MAASRIQLISKKIIKPSSPTPSSFRSYKLSFLDQLLERSLSRLLRSYYPFAGTLTDNISVNCNDKGATFLEARINSSMKEILQEPDSTVQDIVFPSDLPWKNLGKGNIVVAQLNHFNCGGIALGVCMSHKLGDASSLISFMNDWGAMARQSNEEPMPKFLGASVFPPIIDTPVVPIYRIPRQENAGRRFVFSAKKITQLKQLAAAESGVQNPTRVEVVTAFLCKSFMSVSMANSQSFSPYVLLPAVNLRRLSSPPLPHNSIGNHISILATPVLEERDMNLSRLVSKLRKDKVEFFERCNRMKLNEVISEELQRFEKQMEFAVQGRVICICSSLCGFPTNTVDFGWGRPTKVVIGALPCQNTFTLIDDINGDGVEATVTLDEQVMSSFETDKDFLAFASPAMGKGYSGS